MATRDEFLLKIRNKYPQYESIDDDVLFDKIIKKYPQYKEKVLEPEPVEDVGFFEKAKNLFTGESRITPEIEGMPTIGQLPELSEMSMSSLKSAFGTLTGDDEEAAQILQANFPGVQIRRDEKGNVIVRSSIDQQDYLLNKPGLDVRDVVRGGIIASMFAPTGRVSGTLGKIGAAAGTQSAIEAAQKATGGEFDIEQVPLAGAVEAIVPGSKAVVSAIKSPRSAVKEAVEGVTDVVKKTPMGLEEVGSTIRESIVRPTQRGRQKAVETLAREALPDDSILQSAKRLGIDEYIEPDHLTTNESYKEFAQAVKSMPGSKSREVERLGLDKLFNKIDDTVKGFGATDDMSTLSSTIKNDMLNVQDSLSSKADELYKSLEDSVSPKSKVSPQNVLAFLEKRIDDLDGISNLSAAEKDLYKGVSKSGGVNYALFDQKRKDIADAAFSNTGPFKDSSKGVLKKIQGEMMKDQEEIAKSFDSLDLFNSAKESVRLRKALEDDMTALFGKRLDQDFIQKLITGTKSLEKGDISKFSNLIKSIPKERRKETVASALRIAMSKSAKDNSINLNNFSNFYENLKRNKQAYNAFMINLPATARAQLNDLYNVSKSVRDAMQKQITTGKINNAEKILNGSDNIVSKIYNISRRVLGKAAIYETIGSSVGMPGTGSVAAMMQVMGKGDKNIMSAADDLLSSPAFKETIKNIGSDTQEKAIRKFSKSKAFKKFYNVLGKPSEMSNAEEWITNAIQGTRQLNDKEETE